MEIATTDSHPGQRDTRTEIPRMDQQTAKARAFVDAIMADLQHPTNPGGLLHGVMKRVPDPYSGITRHVIIRKADFEFWGHLLGRLEPAVAPVDNGGLQRKRVVAVGTPGVGKSTTAASFAIRSLLLEKKKVVYLHRTEDKCGYYIKISPSASEADEPKPQFDIELIPETTSPAHIPLLSDPTAYYVVDPGKTKTSCDPSHLVFARHRCRVSG